MGRGWDEMRQEVVLQVVNKINGAVTYLLTSHYPPESRGMLSKLWFSVEKAVSLSITYLAIGWIFCNLNIIACDGTYPGNLPPSCWEQPWRILCQLLGEPLRWIICITGLWSKYTSAVYSIDAEHICKVICTSDILKKSWQLSEVSESREQVYHGNTLKRGKLKFCVITNLSS